MLPYKLLKDNGIELGSASFALKHDEVVRRVYSGEVDAGATYYSPRSISGQIRDARARVMDELPDVTERVKIITLTERIPNDPLVFSKDLPRSTKETIADLLIDYAQTEGGQQVLKALYGIDGFVKTDDRDYDGLRLALQATEADVSALVTQR